MLNSKILMYSKLYIKKISFSIFKWTSIKKYTNKLEYKSTNTKNKKNSEHKSKKTQKNKYNKMWTNSIIKNKRQQPKYLITINPINLSQNGIIHINLIDFLTKFI